MVVSMGAFEIAIRLVAGAALILANGFFVAIEFGLTRAGQYSEEEFTGQGGGLERAWEMTEDLEIYLTGCQVGITAASISLGIVAEPALATLFAALFAPLFDNTILASIATGTGLAFIILSVLHLAYGEQTPTYLGVERSKQVCRYGATPLYWFTRVIWPILRFGDVVAKWTLGLIGVEMTGAWHEAEGEGDDIDTRSDLHKRLQSTLEEGDLPDERHSEVMNALVIDELSVQDIMVDREKIAALSTENTIEENLAVIDDHPHQRFPLVGEDMDDFRGVVYLPTVIHRFEAFRNGEIDIEEVTSPPMTLPADESVSDAIDRFQHERHELALVEENGTVVGLLTATDAFEEVMGELEDPLDVSVREQHSEEAQGIESSGDPV
jgi:CBS domain containing-hemolysin-like protein